MHSEPGPRDIPSNGEDSGKTEKPTEMLPPASAETVAPSGLTKEEQWALFEKELKESDWGHQPC